MLEQIACWLICAKVAVSQPKINEPAQVSVRQETKESSDTRVESQRLVDGNKNVSRNTTTSSTKRNPDTNNVVSNSAPIETGNSVYTYVVTPTTAPVADVIDKTFGHQAEDAKELWGRYESGLEPCKINGGAINCNYKGNRACGIVQALPCSKLTNKCSLTDVQCQVNWGYEYVHRRYGGAKQALEFRKLNGWY